MGILHPHHFTVITPSLHILHRHPQHFTVIIHSLQILHILHRHPQHFIVIIHSLHILHIHPQHFTVIILRSLHIISISHHHHPIIQPLLTSLITVASLLISQAPPCPASATPAAPPAPTSDTTTTTSTTAEMLTTANIQRPPVNLEASIPHFTRTPHIIQRKPRIPKQAPHTSLTITDTQIQNPATSPMR